MRKIYFMDRVVIGSRETTLELACIERRGGVAETVSARIVGPMLSAEVHAYDDRYEALAAFVDEMSERWTGWPGERSFASLEGDLVVTAVHDGHVRLTVRLWRVDGPGMWSVEADVVLDPGEDLRRAASDVRALVEGDGT